MTDTQNMATLLSKMTSETSGEVKFTDAQAASMVEIFIPRFISAPFMPKGMTCKVDRTATGWTITVTKP